MIAELLVGAGLVLAGEATWAVIWGNRKPKPPKPVEAICGCGHHYSMHDPQTGQCHATFRVRVERGNPKVVNYQTVYTHERWAQEQCGCRRYAGPEPLPSFYAPEISA